LDLGRRGVGGGIYLGDWGGVSRGVGVWGGLGGGLLGILNYLNF